MSKRRNWFLEMETFPGEDAVKTVEMTTKGLGYDLILVDKARLRRLTPIFEEFYCGSNAIRQHCMLQRNCPQKSIHTANFTGVSF